MSYVNSVDPDQTPHFAALNLDSACLPMSYVRGARNRWA